jgi:hypothetical protein
MDGPTNIKLSCHCLLNILVNESLNVHPSQVLATILAHALMSVGHTNNTKSGLMVLYTSHEPTCMYLGCELIVYYWPTRKLHL